MVRLKLPQAQPLINTSKTSKLLIWIKALILIPPVIFGICFFGFINYWHFDFDEKLVDDFVNYKPPLVTEILYRNGESMVKFPGIGDWSRRTPEYRQWVKYEEVPELVRNAIMSAEDQRFLTHDGLDYRGITRAFVENGIETLRRYSRTGKFKPIFATGASTLAQQAIELTLLSNEHEKEIQGKISHFDKFAGKVNKMRMSVWLEQTLSAKAGKLAAKQRIFEVVANISYCGNGQYGILSAANYFFGKTLDELTPAEAATIAALFRSPDKYSPYRNERVMLSRRNGVLKIMADWNYIDSKKLEDYYAEPLRLIHHKKEKEEAGAAVQFTLRELWSKGTRIIKWENGAKVLSTIDYKAQHIGNDAVRFGLGIFKKRQLSHVAESINDEDRKFFRSRADGIQSALVVLQNGTGEILAMVGGVDNNYTSFNRAVDALRQPGSAFKPFVYGAAIEKGEDIFRIDCLRPGTGDCRISDSPISVKMGRGRPRHYISNYDGRVYGSLPAWVAFARSQNMAAMHLARRIGMNSVLNFANRLGLDIGENLYPTTAIGAAEVTVLNLAAAYATFPFYGVYSTPHIVNQINTNLGEIITFSPRLYPVIEPESALTIVELLRHPVLYRSGTARSLNDVDYPVQIAGKTGTTNNFRDAWFCGFTYGLDGITACAWVGMDDRTPLATGRDESAIKNVEQRCSPLHPKKRDYCEAGGKTALPIVKYFMEEYYKGRIPPVFPDGINAWVNYVHKHDFDPTR
ncbi:MAG: transglycosylase domain-containing protein [bacterium]|nr:transglycosylase domain-containing protein [bacterium]